LPAGGIPLAEASDETLVAPRRKQDALHWNLECTVGKGGQNTLPCEVSNMHGYCTLAAQHALTPQDLKAVYSKVAVTGRCTGTDSDRLLEAFPVHQKAPTHRVIDGKFSIATGDGKVGANAFFILRLNARLSDMHPNVRPRLDLIPGYPGVVADAVRACVPRVSA
jgi:hypothetical protein